MVGSLSKEREAIAPYIEDNEPVVGRHFVTTVSGDNGATLHQGAVILSTDRKLLMVTTKGTLRPKWRVDEFEFSSLKPGVGNQVKEMFGNPHYFSNFARQSGPSYLLDSIPRRTRTTTFRMWAERWVHGTPCTTRRACDH
jgi:hypothetical protein